MFRPKPEGTDVDPYASADPTTYSPLVPGEGDVLHAIPPEKQPQKQQAIARLLKGIINVSDLIETPQGFVSKEMPLEKVVEPSRRNEVLADIELLSLVFNDYDHALEGEHNLDGAVAASGHQNLRVENDRVAYYDFDRGTLARAVVPKLRREVPEGALRILVDKLDALYERFRGEEGKQFIASIVSASGMRARDLFPLGDSKTSWEERDIELLQMQLINRVSEGKLQVIRALSSLAEAA